MFLDNDKTLLAIHYGLQNGIVQSNTVLRWVEAIQADRIRVSSYLFHWLGLICMQLFLGLNFSIGKGISGNRP